LYSYQDIEFDYSNFFENDVSKYEKLNERTLQEWRKHEPQQYETARAAVLQQISEKNFPYRDATLAVTGSTLAIFGGNHDSIWSCSDILTLNLSPLLPYLSLEQLAGIAASKKLRKLFNRGDEEGGNCHSIKVQLVLVRSDKQALFMDKKFKNSF
jgi:hypothetical protein